MNLRLLSLAFAPFAFGTSAFVFVGLLTPMSEDLGVGIPVIGQLQTVFAVACGIGGPILARLLSKYNSKRLLVIVMALLMLMNIASALAPQFGAIAMIRFAGGLFAALSIPLASTIAVNSVAEIDRPRAIATVMAGYTLAFLFGMPIGSALGDLYGWRAAFWFAALISFLAVLIIGYGTKRTISTAPPLKSSKELPAQTPTLSQNSNISFRSALAGDNFSLMVISLLSFLATFMTIAYIGPVITKATGLEGTAIGGVQIAMGIGGIIGLPIGAYLGRLPIRRALLLIMGVICVTQILYSTAMMFDLGWAALPILILNMTLGSAAIFANLPVVQTRLALKAGAAATIAFALNSSMVYFGQGIGATFGGLVTASFGLSYVGLIGALLASLAFIMIARLEP